METLDCQRCGTTVVRGVAQQEFCETCSIVVDRARMAWSLRIRVPFSYALSKNAVWSMAQGGGHVFMRKKASQARSVVRDTLASALSESGIAPVEAKVFIDIFVQKPNHKGDAINVIDSVCDGIKDALGVDDRWFSIRGLDWEVVKTDPMIIIGVGQEAREHHRVCSACGRIMPLDAFGKRSGMRLGSSRECLECRRLASKRGVARRRKAGGSRV